MKEITYLFAHGAGAPKNSEWMNLVAKKLTQHSRGKIKVKRFNFDYMERSKKENKKFPPDRMPRLIEKWEKEIIKHAKNGPIFIGGKSMGGRAATLLPLEFLQRHVKGIINFGFPFHAPGKEPGERIIHLEKFKTPCLINQGERDPMGTKDEIKNYKISKKVTIKYLVDGNHDLKPRVKSGLDLDHNLVQAVENTIEFIEKLLSK